jgi:hypothetical protein
MWCRSSCSVHIKAITLLAIIFGILNQTWDKVRKKCLDSDEEADRAAAAAAADHDNNNNNNNNNTKQRCLLTDISMYNKR